MPHTGFATVTVQGERLNGLRLLATKQNRSVSNMLDTILDRAGVETLSERELQRRLNEKEKEVAAT